LEFVTIKILWFACGVQSLERSHSAGSKDIMDYAYGQQVLEEDYDENYEPTEEGT
jgi:hypothetical protein